MWCPVIGQHEILGMGYFKGHLWVYNRALKRGLRYFKGFKKFLWSFEVKMVDIRLFLRP